MDTDTIIQSVHSAANKILSTYSTNDADRAQQLWGLWHYVHIIAYEHIPLNDRPYLQSLMGELSEMAEDMEDSTD